MRGLAAALVFPMIAACGGASQPPLPNTPRASEVAIDEDSSDDFGSDFVCEGEGPTKQAARVAARASCSDKVCRLCGVEVESVVRTTETLEGVAMQRRVVERCNQVREDSLDDVHETGKCESGRCSVRLQIHLSKENQERECAAQRSGKFSDPALCERLVDEYSETGGRDAASFQTRIDLLDQATSACSAIDQRPSPRLKRMLQQLDQAMTRLLTDPDEDISVYLNHTPREERDKTLVGRLQGARAAMPRFKIIAEVLDATKADDISSRAGVARLLKALKAAPATSRDPKTDVRLYPASRLHTFHYDYSSIIAFYRRTYSPDYMRGLERSIEDANFTASASVTNRNCGSSLVAKLDWNTFDDEALHSYSISGYCSSVLSALSSVCSSPSGKTFTQRLQSVECRHGGTGELRLSNGQLSWSINFELVDLDSLAKSALYKLPSDRAP